MKTLYFPGKGGAYRSFLTDPSTITYCPQGSIGLIEDEFLGLLGQDHRNAISNLEVLRGQELELMFYALDEEALSFVKLLSEYNITPYYNNKKLTIENTEIMIKAAKEMRNKAWFYDLAKSINQEMIVEEGSIYKNYDHLVSSLDEIKENPGLPLIIKSSCGKGGKGNLVCKNDNDLVSALEIIKDTKFSDKSEYGESATQMPFIVEKYYNKAPSYNVTFNCTSSNEDEEFFYSQQLVDEVFYRGNQSATSLDKEKRDKIEGFLKDFKKKVTAIGYEGWVGLDFIDTPDGIKVIEVNPRINSVSHVFRLNKTCTFRMSLCSYEGRKEFNAQILYETLKPHLYDKETGKGMIPYAIPKSNGVLLLYYTDNPHKLEQEFSEILSQIPFKENKQELIRDHSSSVSYYLSQSDVPGKRERKSSSDITHYIVVSTEDDKYCVKGGIGTYLGTLVDGLQKFDMGLQIKWFTQSPNDKKFNERNNNLLRVYLPRQNEFGDEIDIDDYAKLFVLNVRNEIAQILKEDPNARIVVESPDWEGLLADLYQESDNPRVLKVSKIHTPLSVTSSLSGLEIDEDKRKQISRETKQMCNSDLLSSPTKYIIQAAKDSSRLLLRCGAPEVIIPNCIKCEDYVGNKNSRSQAINIFRNVTNQAISEDSFNIFVVGSVEKRKGIEIVVRAVEEIIGLIPNAQIYFIGHYVKDNGDSLTANDKLSPSFVLDQIPEKFRGHVHFTGYIDHDKMPSIMNAGDIFPICYLGDNFPGTIAEIGLSQRPMIVIPRGGVKEMIKKDGEYLTQVIDGSSNEELASNLARKLLDFAKDPEYSKELAPRFRSHLISSFDATKIVQRMLEEYSSRISEKCSNPEPKKARI